MVKPTTQAFLHTLVILHFPIFPWTARLWSLAPTNPPFVSLGPSSSMLVSRLIVPQHRSPNFITGYSLSSLSNPEAALISWFSWLLFLSSYSINLYTAVHTEVPIFTILSLAAVSEAGEVVRMEKRLRHVTLHHSNHPFYQTASFCILPSGVICKNWVNLKF